MQHSLDELVESLLAFRDERDWQQFHSLRALITAAAIEAGELLELTQWKTDEQVEAIARTPELANRLQEEAADLAIYLLLIAERAGFDLSDAVAKKIARNNERYPVDKSRGNAKKYTEF